MHLSQKFLCSLAAIATLALGSMPAYAFDLRADSLSAAAACVQTVHTRRDVAAQLSQSGFSVKKRSRKTVYSIKETGGGFFKKTVSATVKKDLSSCTVVAVGLQQRAGDALLSNTINQLKKLCYQRKIGKNNLGMKVTTYVRGDTSLVVNGTYSEGVTNIGLTALKR